jgi:hypothetical protein
MSGLKKCFQGLRVLLLVGVAAVAFAVGVGPRHSTLEIASGLALTTISFRLPDALGLQARTHFDSLSSIRRRSAWSMRRRPGARRLPIK